MPSLLEIHKPRYDGLRVTREEYLDLSEDGFKYDVIEGVMHLSPSATADHGSSQGNFVYLLKRYLETHPEGRLFLEVDIFLSDRGDVLRPDISFVLKDRLQIVKNHIHGAPDLVCEVLSDSTANRDLGVKAGRYLACGIKEYWIVDPRDKTVQLWLNRKDSW